MQEEVAATHLSAEIVSYVVELIGATRSSEKLLRGASPRATLAVTAMAKAVAQLRGRDYVVPRDVQEVFLPTVAHRLLLSSGAEAQNLSREQILQDILRSVSAPKLR